MSGRGPCELVCGLFPWLHGKGAKFSCKKGTAEGKGQGFRLFHPSPCPPTSALLPEHLLTQPIPSEDFRFPDSLFCLEESTLVQPQGKTLPAFPGRSWGCEPRFLGSLEEKGG